MIKLLSCALLLSAGLFVAGCAEVPSNEGTVVVPAVPVSHHHSVHHRGGVHHRADRVSVREDAVDADTTVVKSTSGKATAKRNVVKAKHVAKHKKHRAQVKKDSADALSKDADSAATDADKASEEADKAAKDAENAKKDASAE